MVPSLLPLKKQLHQNGQRALGAAKLIQEKKAEAAGALS